MINLVCYLRQYHSTQRFQPLYLHLSRDCLYLHRVVGSTKDALSTGVSLYQDNPIKNKDHVIRFTPDGRYILPTWNGLYGHEGQKVVAFKAPLLYHSFCEIQTFFLVWIFTLRIVLLCLFFPLACISPMAAKEAIAWLR